MGRLLKLKQVDEPRDLKHVLDVVVHVAQGHFVSLGLILLEQVEQNAQSAGSDILQFLALDDDVIAFSLGDGLERLFDLDGSCGVERADKGDKGLLFEFLDCSFQCLNCI